MNLRRKTSTSGAPHGRRPTPLHLAVAAALAWPALAAAQSSNAASGQTEADAARKDVAALETVTVTARRREESLRDVPVAVTAMSEQRLEALNVRNLGDLQSQVPSLTAYASRGSNTTLTTFIRGVGQADPLWGVDPGVGLYLDDVYIARPQGALLEVFDTERIEVLRGPQGTLYGKNTIGGAIKYVSRKLGTQNEGSASLALGNHGQVNARLALGGASSDGQWRGRVAVASLQHEGYGKNLSDGSDVSDQDTRAARVQLGFFPTGTPITVQLSADTTRDDSNMRGFQRLAANLWDAAKTPASSSRYDIKTGMANANKTDSSGYALTATWQLSEAWAAKYIHAWRESDTATAIDFDGLPNKIADVRASYKDHSRSNELQFAFDGGGSHSGVIGLYHFDGQAGGSVASTFIAGTPYQSFGVTGGTVYTKGKAAYGDWSWRLTPQLGVSAGLRYTQESKRAVVLNQAYANDSFTTPIATLSNFDKSLEVSNTAPRLAVDLKISPTTTLYASASRGFKSGGYNVRANVAAVPDSAKPFKDEVLDSYELGMKTVLDQGRLEVNAALFHNNYKNVQLSVFSSYTMPNGQQGFFGDFTNAGRATIDGAELEFLWRPAQAWTLSGYLALLDARFKEYFDRGVNVAAQKKFSNTPDAQGALNIEHRADAPFGGVLRTRLGVSARSKVYPTTDLSEAIAQGGHALWSAGVIWERDRHLSFALQGSNLGDKAYRTDGYNIPSLGILTGYYGAPRQLTASVSYRF